MSERDSGGYAFPFSHFETPDGMVATTTEYGLTLRDYFAAHADISNYTLKDTSQLCAFAGVPEPDPDAPDYIIQMVGVSAKAVAKLRFLLADAMISARTSKEA